MMVKIIRLKPLPGFVLWAEFNNGKQTCYHVSKLFDRIPAFRDLRDIPGLFEQVRIDTGGYGISWNDDLDLAADELLQNGYPVTASSLVQPGKCCPTCGQMIRRKSPRQAAASRANGKKGGRPKTTPAKT